MNSQQGPTVFRVVVNEAAQLSLWPAEPPPPAGWSAIGPSGTRPECLDWVRRHADAEPKPSGRSGRTLVAMFAETVRRHGARPAVTQDDVTLTYDELDRRSARLAALLADTGVGAEDRVALCLDRGIDTVVAVLGVLRAGGAYLALDTYLPLARRATMIGQAGAIVVLTSPARAGELDVSAHVLGWTSADTETASQPAWPGPAPDGAACLLFTSGSSGAPKAVVLEHAGLVAFAQNPTFAALSAADRMAHLSPLGFDAFHYELWASLAVGAELVVLPTLRDLLGTDVRRELRRRRITAALVPTMGLNHLVRDDRNAFDALRVLCTGGDVLSRQTCLDVLASDFTGIFVNLYGPTEATTACAAYEIADAEAVAAGVPIGTAMPGYRVAMRQPDLTVTPTGEVGELYIGGIGVARGYAGRPELTADRFVPDPDGPPGSRMYATGDRAARRPDGLLDFRGRVDEQVKIRGYRVEIGEVERAVGGHPQVSDVAVLATGEGEDRYLAAIVVALQTIAPAELRSYLAESLPEYMVPGVILLVDTLPATNHGKRDLAQLAALLEEHRKRTDRYVTPVTESQQYLVRVWERLLGLDRIGIHDDFFELGGHSLLAFRMQRHIRRDLHVDLNFGELVSTSRLADMAGLIDDQAKG